MNGLNDKPIDGNALLQVLRGRETHRRPCWLMRQAGRYLPEYREVRAKAGSFLDLCYNPELATEVTLQPLRRFDLDAAIVFADILVVPHAMGLGLRFAEGEGPMLDTVRSEEDLARLIGLSGSKEVARVCETLSLTRGGLAPDVALIGFCGAPWTVASYMVEGGSSDRTRCRIAAYRREPWFLALIDRLVEESVSYLCAQIESGADVVQIFDSWAGDLVGDEISTFVVEPISRLVRGVKVRFPDVPIIAFARGIGLRHREIEAIPGVSAVGVESEVELAALGLEGVVQGNLDPVALLAGPAVAEREAIRICGMRAKERHIFNLGHGIRVGTEPATVDAVVKAVRSVDG